jgi:integrase
MNFPSQSDWLLLRDYLRGEVEKDSYDWFKVMIFLQLETGARISEARTLKWERGPEDIHAGSSQTFSYLQSDSRTWTIHYKKRLRNVPISEMGPSAGSLPKLLSRVPRRKDAVYVFENPKTQCPYILNSIPKMFRRLLAETKVKKPFTTHGNRHGFISFCLNHGMTAYQVGQIVGHSESQITEMYAHPNVASLGALFEVMRGKWPRIRRVMHMGHGDTDVTDRYERVRVESFLKDDAEKLRSYIFREWNELKEGEHLKDEPTLTPIQILTP